MTEHQSSVDTDDKDWSLAWLERNLGLDVQRMNQLEKFVDLLLMEAGKQNLIAKATEASVWSRHIIDSAQLLTHVPRETSDGLRWLDIGSGAGLPGLVNAILKPADYFTLVERRPLRTDWLERAKAAVGLDNVTVIQAPVSALPDQTFDVITARAFAPMPKLFAQAKRFAMGTTLWILPKGRSASDELKAIPGWQGRFHVEPSVTDDDSGIIVGQLGPDGSGVRR